MFYFSENSVFLRVTVMHSYIIKVVSYIMGWIYFAAWSVSFYPQIYINFKRKSVVGLNFDFLSLNIVGFIMYSMFNCALFFSEAIQVSFFNCFAFSNRTILLLYIYFMTLLFCYTNKAIIKNIICRTISKVNNHNKLPII